jgi:hypothetical protein
MLRILDVSRNDGEPIPFWEMSRHKENVISSIKEVMYSGIFKHPTGALANSIQGYVTGQSIYIISDKPYADAQDRGVPRHVMWALLGKTIPIRTFHRGGSTVVYRKATIQSFLNGGWVHPGITAKQFVSRGVGNAMTGNPGVLWTLRSPIGIPRAA